MDQEHTHVHNVHGVLMYDFAERYIVAAHSKNGLFVMDQ